MKNFKKAFSFLAIGKTQESKEASENFKRYVGLASSYVLGVNPDKKALDEIFGFESQNEPEYIKEGENGKEAHIQFIVKTDAEANNGIEIINRLMFTLRQAPAYNQDQTKVQVVDKYGNFAYIPTEDAKNGRKPENNGKLDTSFRMACVGEADLVGFLKKYLCVPDAFEYKNGTWLKKADADDYVFALEHIKDYFNGDFSELKEALALQPNNKVKLLYGVKTSDEGKQYQVVAARNELILPNSASSSQVAKIAQNLADAKNRGSFATTDFRVQELAEYTVEPTNLESSSTGSSDDQMPW